MGKSFKGFSKALSLILAVAMVVTCVPTSAYAAELLSVDESEDILVNDTVAEEASDALVDASASEEKSSSLIDTQKEADLAAAPEENTSGEEDFGPDRSLDDTPIWIANVSGDLAGDETKVAVSSHLKLYPDGTSSTNVLDDSEATDFDADKFINASGAARTAAGTDTDDTAILAGDKDNDFSFYLRADAGYPFGTDPKAVIAKIWYVDYTKAAYGDVADAYPYKAVGENKGAVVDVTSSVSATVTEFSDSTYKFTIPKATLKAAHDVSAYKKADESTDYALPTVIVQIKDNAQAKAVVPFTYTVPADKSTDYTLSDLQRTVKYGTAGQIENVKKTVKAGTLATTNVKVTYTPDGGEAIEYTTQDDDSKIEANQTLDKVAKHVAYENGTANGTLFLSSTLVNAFTLGEGTLTVEIDTTESSAGKYAVSAVVDSAYAKIGATASTELPTIIDKNVDADWTFYAAAEGTTPNLKGARGITVTAKQNDGTGVDVAGTAPDFKIEKAKRALISDDIVITVSTYEKLFDKSGSDATLKNSKGANLADTDLVSGKPLKFAVVPAAGKNVKEVSYSIGQDTTAKTVITEDADGLYTTAAVTDGLTINVTTEDQTKIYNVSLTDAVSASEATIHDGKTDAGTAISTTAAVLAEKNKPYYFTVKRVGENDISSVVVKSGDTLDTATDVAITKISDDSTDAVYKTNTNISHNVFITVTMSAARKITAPANKKVTVDFAANVDANKQITVPSANDFYFTITPASSSVSIASVKKALIESPYTESSVTKTVDKSGKEVYKISSSDLTTGTTKGFNLIVDTYEQIPLNDSSYTAVFALSGETPTSTAYIPALVNTYSDEAKTKIASQKLVLALGEKTNVNTSATNGYITAQFNATDKGKTDLGKAKTQATELVDAAGHYVLDGLYPDSYHKNGKDSTEDIITLAGNSGEVIGTAANIGTDKITAQVVFDETGNTTNHLVYRAELPVEISARYKDVKVVVTRGAYNATTNASEITAIYKSKYDHDFSSATGNEDNIATFTAIGTNVRTNKTDVLPTSAVGVWKFEPYNPDKNPLTASMVDTVTALNLTENKDIKSSVVANKNTIYVASKAAEDLAVKVPITVNGAKEATDYTASVEVIDKKVYKIYPTAQVVGAAAKEGTAGIGFGTTFNLEAATTAGSINNATFTLDLYEDKTAGGDADITTAANLKTALDAKKVEKVAPEYTYVLTNSDSTDTEYATVTKNSDGSFTVTAKKAHAAAGYSTLTVSAIMNGVKVDSYAFKFAITDKFEKQAVYLKLDNPALTDDSLKVPTINPDGIKQQKLTDTYYTSKVNSIVEYSKANPITIDKRGIMFTNEMEGNKFVLPTQDKFDQTVAGKAYVLVAWQDGNNTKLWHYPGEEITVSNVAAKNTFTAVWATAYDWPAADKGTSVAAPETNNGLAIYNKNVNSGTAEAPVYAAFTSADNASTPTVVNGNLSLGNDTVTAGSVPVALKMLERKPIEEDITTTNATIADLLAKEATYDETWIGTGIALESTTADHENIVNLDTAGTVKPVAGAAGRTADLRASWTYEGVTYKTIPLGVAVEAAPTYTLTLPDTNMKVEQTESGGVLKTLTATLKRNGGGVTETDYEWKWTVGGAKTIELTDVTGHPEQKSVTAKAAGVNTISVTATDANGVVINLAQDAKVTVTESGAGLTLMDKDNKPANKVLAWVVSGTSKATGYKLAPDVDGIAITGTVVGDGTYVAAGSVGADNSISIEAANAELSDKGWFRAVYTYNGETFAKVVPVETYYTITLDAGAGTMVQNGTPVTPAATTATITVPFSSQKVVEATSSSPAVYTYENISLDGYTAAPSATTDAFKNWKGASSTATYTTSIDKLTGKGAAGASGTLSAGTFTLTANYETQPVKVEVPDNYVYLVNDSDSKLAPGKVNSKAINLSVTPATAPAHLWVVPDKINIFNATYKNESDADKTGVVKDNFGLAINNGEAVTTTRTDKVTLSAIAPASLAKRAGTAELSVREGSVTGTEVAKLYLFVDGYDSESKTYFESGAIVKDVIRTIEGDNYYFDTTGVLVEGTKIATKGDGTKILIIADKVAAKGKRTAKIDDETNTYYVGENGEILTGWITSTGTKATSAADGVYYADPETGAVAFDTLIADGGKFYLMNTSGTKVVGTGTGSIVAYNSKEYFIDKDGVVTVAGLATVDGKQYLFREDGSKVKHGDADVVDGKIAVPAIGGPVYVIEDDDTAKLDKKNVNAKFTWKTKKPSKFEKSSPLPTNEFEITYNVEGDTEKKTVTGTVTAVADPSDYQTIVGLTKLTFTFTPSEADIAGFFSDDKGEKALTVDPEVWTFNFKNGGSTSSSGGIEIVGLEEEYKFAGTAIKPVITVEDNDLGITLAEGVDYKLSFKDNTKIGTATITVDGKGNYQGKTVTGQFKIVSPTDGITAELAGSVKKIAKISESFVYDGEAKYPTTITVTTTDGDIVYQHSSGDTYTTENAKEVALSFANNVNAGSATVAATGKDGKTKKTTFKITKVDLSAAGDKLEIAADNAAWAVKGAVPEVTVTYTPEGGSAITLVNGKDYKVDVTYAAKKNVATGNTVKITGKGTNFTKSAVSGAFEIEKYALSDASIVSVGAYAGVAPKAIKAIVVDGNGVIIPAKQYTLKIEKDSEDISTSKTKLVAGDAITVTVTAAEGGNLDGSGSVDVTIAPDLNKAKVVLSDTLKKNGVEYTGAPIDLESYGDDSKNFFEDGITVQLKNASKTLETLEYGTDFEVAGYQNNIKKGTMTVYIRGISEKCSGTKAFKVKISAKTMKKAE